MTQWNPTACILCECNCGIEVQFEDGDARRFKRFRGDKAHPGSQGYACEKPHRLDFYQNGDHRLTTPLRRRPDGTFEAIDWDTAIREVADRLAAIRDELGGDKIFYYGGGGQGNHLPGAYATATRRLLGSRYKSNALAQEKTGEFWIADRMVGAMTRSDFEHCDVAFFLGKNPWFSHSIQRARVVLKEIAADPDRTLIVVDPRRTKTAALADIHLQVRPGCDAWLLTALVAALIQDGLVDREFVSESTSGFADVERVFANLDIAEHCAHAGVSEEDVRRAASVMAGSRALATFEDLGVQMNRHSTLASYLHRLLWMLTGNFGKPGTQYIPTPLVPFAYGATGKTSPVTGARIISGLVPCNVIAEEILSDHPDRYRAMIVEAANPAHSLADGPAMREALQALQLLVVIDVTMSETAELADYVLPASSQFEKAEATFFNFEFPANYFHLRRQLLDPPDGALPEAEIHARLCEALGAYGHEDLEPLKVAAREGLQAYAMAFMQHVLPNPALNAAAPAILYRTLGPELPKGSAEGALLFGLAVRFAMEHGEALARAGFDGPMPALELFEAMIERDRGFIFNVQRWEDLAPRTPSGAFELALDDMLEIVRELGEPDRNDSFPFVLSAGERRSFTANTIIRDPNWRKKDVAGALRMSPDDARALQVDNGSRVVVETARGHAEVTVEVTDSMQPGHISLPNGAGLGHPEAHGEVGGVAPNELTSSSARDPFAGTPWHKYVPARVRAVQ